MNLTNVSGKRPDDRGRVPALLAALAGVIAFTLLLDPSIINPFHVGWLADGDPAASYIGWLFFRHEPWSLPLGVLHSLGMEQASSIVYADSIPLLAIFFKLFSAWLPARFQYDGIWLCACYALQGYFACRLLMLFTDRRPVLVIGVVLFLLSPIMLFRAPAHLALTAHWFIVAALYLYYAATARQRVWQWLLLLWLAPLVHAYLMFMVYAVWGAYLLRYGWLDRRWPVIRSVAWLGLSVAGSLAMMWLAGYFLDMDVSSGGFGYYSLNLLAPFLPIGAGPFVMHAPVPATTGQYEGFNYLGLGISLALVATALHALLRRDRADVAAGGHWRTGPDAALIACCVILATLAISNQVTLGSHLLFTLPVPSGAAAALNVFRASGRLFWPVYYLLVLAVLRGALRLSAPMCARWLLLVLAVQVVDVFPFVRSVNASSTVMATTGSFPDFASPFWHLARQRYANLYVIPGAYAPGERIHYEMLASDYGFAIDTAYYARMPSARLQESRERRHEQFFEGELDPHGLYLVQSTALNKLAKVQQTFAASTGIGVIDGFSVVAPQWFNTAQGHYLHAPEVHDFPPATVGQNYTFGSGGSGQDFLLDGWSQPGVGATWSEGSSAVLAFQVTRSAGDLRVNLNVEPYLPAAYPQLNVRVELRGKTLASWRFQRNKPGPDTTVDLPERLRAADGNIVLTLRFDQARSPAQSGESVDARKLAVLIHGLLVSPK